MTTGTHAYQSCGICLTKTTGIVITAVVSWQAKCSCSLQLYHLMTELPNSITKCGLTLCIIHVAQFHKSWRKTSSEISAIPNLHSEVSVILEVCVTNF